MCLARPFFTLALVTCSCTLASANDKTAWPRKESSGQLRITAAVQPDFGEWQTQTFSYTAYVNSTSKDVTFNTPDQGRGFCGTVAYLRFPSGEVRSYGEEWVDPKKYPPYKNGSFTVAPGSGLKSQSIDLRNAFGILQPGSYQLQLVVPGDRYYLGGDHGPDLVSKNCAFTIVANSDRTKAVLRSEAAATNGIKLTVTETHVVADTWIADAKATLTNNSSKKVYVTTGNLLNDAEELTARLTWQPKDFIAYDHHGMQSEELLPGQQKAVRVNVPGDRGIYRFIVRLTSEDKKSVVLRSNAIEVSRKADVP